MKWCSEFHVDIGLGYAYQQILLINSYKIIYFSDQINTDMIAVFHVDIGVGVGYACMLSTNSTYSHKIIYFTDHPDKKDIIALSLVQWITSPLFVDGLLALP